MILNIWVKFMNKNTSKLKQILIILLYRTTPYFEGNNELASGVNIEAYSIEDDGKLHFNVYVYNVQDGIVIDYATGESKLAE